MTTTTATPITGDSQLDWCLRQGPTSAKELARLTGKSESRIREILKKHQDKIPCKKNDAGVNVFWLPPEDAVGSPETTAEPEAQVDKAEEAETAPTATETRPEGDAETCPLCQAEGGQVQAGPEDTYMGAARTCGACNRTYNVHTREEVKMAKSGKTTKRTPLNPQYKINAKVDAAKAAGGKLTYEKDGRTWLLTKKGMEPKRMSAKEFSIETPETITAALTA